MRGGPARKRKPVSAAATRAAAPKPASAGAPPASEQSELRNVTVLVADIVQSTRNVLDLDPDEVRAYLDHAAEIMLAGVRKFGGAIVSIQGDGVLAVFGAPAATEDHALRGCLAAMEIRDAFATFPPFPGVPGTWIRIGLHSGGASTRPKVGAKEEFDANGAVVHMATKVEQMCTPGGVAASIATVRLVRGYVRSKSLGSLVLGGDETALQVEELLEVSPDYQLEHYFSHRRLSPLVGREQELKILTDALQPAKGPAVIGIIGEAGFGKSRLCHEARAVAVRQGFRVAEIRGVSMNSATPFAPLRACLAQLLPLGEAQGGEEFLAKRGDGELDPAEVGALTAIFGLAQPNTAWASMSGDARNKAITNGFAKTIQAVARQRPLLVIVEDVHDLDHETRACIHRAIERLERGCVYMTSRPEGAEAIEANCAKVIVLEALAPADARRLVRNEMRGGDVLLRHASSGLIESVLQRANGNPFMLEELVRGLASPNTRGIGGVPMSIEILIRSRVDKLPPDARRLLQCASVLGMRFPAAVLRQISGLDAEAFETALGELVRERFLVADAGLFVEFAHQITRVACYEGIAHEARAGLHRRILEVTESGEHRMSFSFEALADHAYRAGQLEQALDFLWEACKDSIAHSAVLSVAELRRRALGICEELGPSADLRAVDFSLRTFDAIQQLGAYLEIVDSLESALKVAEASGTNRQVCQSCGHLATTYWVLGRYDRAYAMAERALAMALEANDLPLASYAQLILGCIQFMRGNIEDAVRLERELSEQLTGKLETARFGAVAVMGVQSRAFLSWFLSDLGRFEEAESAAADAMRVANATQQPYSQLLAHMAVGYRLLRLHRFEEAATALQRAYNVCRAGAFLALDAFISAWYATALVRCGLPEEARRIVQRAIELDLGRYAATPGSYYVYDSHAHILAGDGRGAEAMQAIEQAARFMLETRDPTHYAYALYSRAELVAALGGDRDVSRRNYAQARRRARRLGMRRLEAECQQALDALG
jgi:class 3 adenylate cyclase/tetratricopeptide (TPR) repeat protein